MRRLGTDEEARGAGDWAEVCCRAVVGAGDAQVPVAVDARDHQLRDQAHIRDPRIDKGDILSHLSQVDAVPLGQGDVIGDPGRLPRLA
ncbi:MAG: hypothetical protein BWY79_02185 [Actinobacteria bacterium ADurb.Bin444]|nr:MAG: hypothetical protein BWY79_02185 [Actinobacteria bacterium ADurb.Bin444]